MWKSFKFAIAAALFSAVYLIATPAPAQVLNDLNVHTLREIISDEGYRAKLVKGKFLLTNLGGAKAIVKTFGCNKENVSCKGFYARVYFGGKKNNVTFRLDTLNKWSGNKRFGRVHLDKDKDLVLTHNVFVDAQVSKKFYKSQFLLVDSVFRSFKKFMVEQTKN